MKRLQVGLGLFIGLSFVFVSSLWAQQQPPDNPPANQGAGQHSTIMTSNGKLRDDQLADMIKDAINNSGKTPTSVKVFFNSCYGGGMLDDIANMLKDDFEPDIPFVGASASASNEVAWGPKNSVASTTGGGSYWTDSLAGAMAGANPGDNVSGTIGTANANDPAKAGGPVGSNLPPKGKPETPQNTTANGGAAVNWGPGEGVVFSGGNNRVRHDNNVDKMEGAFLDMFGQCYSSADPANGTTKEALGNMLNAACNDLDGTEELVLYVDDHGDTEFDFDEWFDWFIDGLWDNDQITLDASLGWSSLIGAEMPILHDGWQNGLEMNYLQGDVVSPGLSVALDLRDYELPPITPESFFDVYFETFLNAEPLLVDPSMFVYDPATGSLAGVIPIPYDPANPFLPQILTGPNLLSIMPTPPSQLPPQLPPLTAPVPVANLELTSGPINDLDHWWYSGIPEPGTLGLLGLAGILPLVRRRTR